ncbi:hypothetical protein FA13DRAFT_1805330 [Coprinellus micaceus]|uniref:Uncharacterized protein n=1 Tax=Coprinellus micaceus TaxID=71717 RepID=A0A4Y7S0E4_COPMI|nr:hypothetical protein FA13DRAFT_1805330 [Coprinellus micaceus]
MSADLLRSGGVGGRKVMLTLWGSLGADEAFDPGIDAVEPDAELAAAVPSRNPHQGGGRRTEDPDEMDESKDVDPEPFAGPELAVLLVDVFNPVLRFNARSNSPFTPIMVLHQPLPLVPYGRIHPNPIPRQQERIVNPRNITFTRKAPILLPLPHSLRVCSQGM